MVCNEILFVLIGEGGQRLEDSSKEGTCSCRTSIVRVKDKYILAEPVYIMCCIADEVVTTNTYKTSMVLIFTTKSTRVSSLDYLSEMC